MKTLSGHLIEYMDHTEDDTSANQSRGIRRMNEAQLKLLASKNYWFKEKEGAINSVANQGSYNLPLDYQKMVSVRIAIDGTDYILEEEVSSIKFDIYNREGVGVTSDYPIYYHIRNGKIILYPVPSSSSKVITLLYQKKPRKMSLLDYTTGTIAVTNNSAAVVGTTTAWVVGNVKAGAYLFIDEQPYEILSVTDATNLTLTRPYEGTTASGLSYVAADVSDIPEEFEDIVWMSATADYYLKRESKTYMTYKSEVNELEARLRIFGQSKTHNLTMHRNRWPLRTINDYPISIG
jgi:hypothetical protein